MRKAFQIIVLLKKNFWFQIKLAFHIKYGNVCVNKIFFQNDSICLVDTLLLRISSMISSADFSESKAPKAFLNEDFFIRAIQK
jgi:hypothetical protein